MIHVDFADFEEMMTFARQLLGELPGGKGNASAVPSEASEDQLGQDHRGDMVPVGAAPAQTAPVTPTAPVASAVPVAPVAQQASSVPPVTLAVPTSAKIYTLDELAAAAIPLMDAGGQQALVELLQRFGVATLPDLPQEQYGAFATALRAMGAKI